MSAGTQQRCNRQQSPSSRTLRNKALYPKQLSSHTCCQSGAERPLRLSRPRESQPLVTEVNQVFPYDGRGHYLPAMHERENSARVTLCLRKDPVRLR
jgi:hypothetical protein